MTIEEAKSAIEEAQKAVEWARRSVQSANDNGEIADADYTELWDRLSGILDELGTLIELYPAKAEKGTT